MIGAHIGGQVMFRGAHLDGKDSPALTAQSMLCDEGFQTAGEISLNGARIGGQLNLKGAHLDGKDSPALTAQRLTVAADMLCDEGFHASGEIDIDGAHIGGQLNLRGAHLDGKNCPADLLAFQPVPQPRVLPVHLIGGDPGKRHPRRHRPLQHRLCQLRLGRERHLIGDPGRPAPVPVRTQAGKPAPLIAGPAGRTQPVK